MKKEDIEFLRELQHELNTQEDEIQAAPRFWGIIEDVDYPTDEDHADNEYIYFYDDGDTLTYDETVEYVESVIEDYDKDIIDDWFNNVKNNYELEDLCIWIRETLDCDVEVCYSLNTERISTQTGCFLTKRAAKLHLAQNGYHYNNGKTYAMTAWRNPEFERVLNILQKMNLDDIKVTEE